MILIWRGWGLLAVVALFPVLASCAGLATADPKWMFLLATSFALLFAGVVCVGCGTRWNRNGTEHSLYFVPIQVWGWVYLTAVGVFAVLAVAGGVYRSIQPRPGPPDPGMLDPTVSVIAGGVGAVVVASTAWLLIKSTRTRFADGSSEAVDAADGFSRESSFDTHIEPGDAPDRGSR